ncbi:transcriptional regulator [Alteribacter lacisalsi]|uniref:Transcriptional regulator n=1 Tax=Alteribacter lacisalsi TaxID=2045244 RepID=A0A2W0HL31_9BACI|nr:DegT/DnrJ/EryC1/StrS family aminotransferase [Alteribacter lacisalsi]PYZ97569.1 transcriptional regulator [Alteribacter lacisalsi]
MISLISLQQQFASIKKEILKEVSQVIDSGQYILGSRVRKLEARIAAKIGVTHAVAVANGTDALVLTLDAYGIGPGDEVITTPYTFFASAEAISRVGATPVFADVEDRTFNIDPEKFEAAITSRTKAVIPVHLFGHPADMEKINLIAKENGLIVIEDACQAFGSEYKGRKAGSLGDAACFSFFPTKNLGTLGDGGMITTNDDHLARKLRILRAHGSEKKYIHSSLGYNSRLDEIHAAILLVAMDHIDDWNSQRIKLATTYNQKLAHVPDLTLPECADDVTHIYHLYCIRSSNRRKVMDQLRQNNVQSAIYYPVSLHLQEVYKHLPYQEGSFPVAESLSATMFALPMSPFLSSKDQQTVIRALQPDRADRP